MNQPNLKGVVLFYGMGVRNMLTTLMVDDMAPELPGLSGGHWKVKSIVPVVSIPGAAPSIQITFQSASDFKYHETILDFHGVPFAIIAHVSAIATPPR